MTAATKNSRTGSGRGGLARVVGLAALAVALLFGAPPAGASERLDLNQASVEQLATLPGIGPAKAAAIVMERNRKAFETVDELERVDGIGAKTLGDLRAHVTVEAAP